MYTLSTDRRPYEPKKTVNVPYWAETPSGRMILVVAHNDDMTGQAVIIKQRDPEDSYLVGDRIMRVALGPLTPLAEGETMSIANTWEIADD